MATIMVTGMSGSLAQLCGQALLDSGYDVVGVDYRPEPKTLPDGISFFQANYNKTRIEDVFRRHRPTAVLHLGRVGNLKMRMGKRFDLNVVGSAKIMELSVKYGVKRLAVFSTFHIYGAHPHNHIPISEEEPLRAATRFPQLADAVQLDNQACTWLYRHRSLRTVVLRPSNVVGSHIRNEISRYLRQPRKVYLAGFNPMWQFIHESDMVAALLATVESDATGVFNVTGNSELPVLNAFKLSGGHVFPMPSSAAKLYLNLRSRFGPTLPAYLLEFMKYPCVILGSKFREAFGFEPQVTVAEAIRECVSTSTIVQTPGSR